MTMLSMTMFSAQGALPSGWAAIVRTGTAWQTLPTEASSFKDTHSGAEWLAVLVGGGILTGLGQSMCLSAL
jgi:hypothetical protein